MHLLTIQAEPVRGQCACGCFMSTNPLHEVEPNSLPCKCGPDLVTTLLQIECGRNDHMSLPGLGRERHFSFRLPVPGSVWLCLSLCLSLSCRTLGKPASTRRGPCGKERGPLPTAIGVGLLETGPPAPVTLSADHSSSCHFDHSFTRCPTAKQPRHTSPIPNPQDCVGDSLMRLTVGVICFAALDN